MTLATRFAGRAGAGGAKGRASAGKGGGAASGADAGGGRSGAALGSGAAGAGGAAAKARLALASLRDGAPARNATAMKALTRPPAATNQGARRCQRGGSGLGKMDVMLVARVCVPSKMGSGAARGDERPTTIGSWALA